MDSFRCCLSLTVVYTQLLTVAMAAFDPAPVPLEMPERTAVPSSAEPEPTGPGSFDALHQETKSVFSYPHMFFDGARVQLVRNVSSHMQVSHQLNIGGTTQPSGYHFAPTFVGHKQAAGGQMFPLLLGDVSSDGSLIAQVR